MFFDLNAFLIAILKRLRIGGLLVLFCAFAGLLVCLVPQLRLAGMGNAGEEVGAVAPPLEELPYLYESGRTVYLPPAWDTETSTDRMAEIVEGYAAAATKEEVMGPLLETFGGEAAAEEKKLRVRMVNYNYRIQSVLEEPYTPGNFYDILRVNISSVPSGTAGSSPHFVRITAVTGAPELSGRIAEAAEKAMSAWVESICGSFEHRVFMERTYISLPSASNGLVPRTFLGSTQKAEGVSRAVITRNCIKGTLLGALLGVAAAVFLSFFLYASSVTLDSEGDLRDFQVPLIGSVRRSRNRTGSIISRMINVLEGNGSSYSDLGEGARAVAVWLSGTETFQNSDHKKSVLLTGCASEEKLKELAGLLQEILGHNWPECTVTASPCITRTANTAELATGTSLVVLLEELGTTRKGDLEGELAFFRQLDIQVGGVLLLK